MTLLCASAGGHYQVLLAVLQREVLVASDAAHTLTASAAALAPRGRGEEQVRYERLLLAEHCVHVVALL